MLAAICNKRTQQNRNVSKVEIQKIEKVVFDLSIILCKPLFGSAASLIIRFGWSSACLGGVKATFIASLLFWITADERPEDQFIKPTAGTP